MLKHISFVARKNVCLLNFRRFHLAAYFQSIYSVNSARKMLYNLHRNLQKSKKRENVEEEPKTEEIKKNTAAVLKHTKKLVLEQCPMPVCTSSDVIIAMDCVGICRSDVHYLEHGKIGKFVIRKPMIVGHEGSGIIQEVGSDVQSLKEGDRVAIEPGIPCRKCWLCKEGKYNLCAHIKFCAMPPVHGNLVRFFKHKPDFCYKLPKNVTMEEGALLEPLAVGVAACRRANIVLGSNVCILGAGPIGLTTTLAAKSFGASKVIVVDVRSDRLKIAKELGATQTIHLCSNMSAGSMVKTLLTKMGDRPDKTIDCCGLPETTETAILVTKSGGTAALLGMGRDNVSLKLMDALSREVDIKGVFRYCNDYPHALALASSGRLNLKRLITHHFSFENTNKAFSAASSDAINTIKVMIHVQPRDKNNPVPFASKPQKAQTRAG